MTIHKLSCNIIEESSRSKTLAVFLSGGVDSNSLAFAAHRLGKKVVAYTFHLEGTPSYDPKKAETISEAIGWKCNTIQVPTNKVADDFLRLRNEYHCVKKTQYECTFPFLYIYPQVSEREILTGFAADGHYGLSRKAIEPSKANVTASKTNFDKFRDVNFTQKNIAAYNQQILLANRF